MHGPLNKCVIVPLLSLMLLVYLCMHGAILGAMYIMCMYIQDMSRDS